MKCYSLFSGSSGNCIYIEKGSTRLLLDAGGSMKVIGEKLQALSVSFSDIDAILVTHEHSDHVKGLNVITKHYAIPIYCLRGVAKEMYLSLLKTNASEAAALAKSVRTVETGEEYEIGEICFSPFRTPHDSVDSAGYIFNGGLLGIATDLGCVTGEVRQSLLSCQNVVLESNYDLDMLLTGTYPPYLKERVASSTGHLDNKDCAAFCSELLESGCRDFTLFHLSRDNNMPELALKESLKALKERGGKEGRDFSLRAADRYEITRVL